MADWRVRCDLILYRTMGVHISCNIAGHEIWTFCVEKEHRIR